MSVSHDLETFWREPSSASALAEWIAAGLAEDRAREDSATAALFPAGTDGERTARATVTAVAEGVVCGGPAVLAAISQLDPDAREVRRLAEGTRVTPGAEILVVDGAVAAVLAGERTALNVLGHLSGIATMAAEWAALVPDVQVLDTRKTTPGLRSFQKFATRCGGAHNHRMDLADMPMVKENHRDLFRRLHGLTDPQQEIELIVERVRGHAPGEPVEIEVEDLPSFLACVAAKVEWILIDNQEPATIRQWLDAAQAQFGAELSSGFEASGGLRRERLQEYATSGVQRLSVGALTHSVTALDVSLHVEWAPEAN
ncbi:MAG: carboxylating nicotinate-nucleotide diphosphorylase [Planctomycetota bacterium]